MVVAESRALAEDAAAAVRGGLRAARRRWPMPRRRSTRAGAEGARAASPSNIARRASRSATATVTRPSPRAQHVFRERFWQHRGVAHPMEGRGVLARPRAGQPQADGLVVDADVARPAAHTLVDVLGRRRGRHPRDRARRWAAASAASTWSIRRSSSIPAAARKLGRAGEVGRGPARAFHERDPRARPVLGRGDRGRRRREAARRCAAA